MSRIRLALFENRTRAEPARQLLIEAGIDAEIHAESSLVRLWFVPRWRAGARVVVPADQAQRAARFLGQWEASESWIADAIRCPECKSFRVDFPQFTEKSVFTNLTMGLIAELGLIERQYYCEECHCMWTRPGKKSRRVRTHLAPNYFLEDTQTGIPTSRVQSQPGGAVGRSQAQRRIDDRATRCRSMARGTRLKTRALGLAAPLLGFLMLGADIELRGAELKTPRLAVRPVNHAPPTASTPTYLGAVLPILMGKCARCHNDQSAILANWLNYETAANKRWEIKRRVWDSWHGSYFKQPMPVANGPEVAAITDEERQEIKDWVEGGAPRGVAPVYRDGMSKTEKIELGRRLFGTICAACHQPTGQGIPGQFPPLAGSDFLNADKHRAIKLVVNGLQGDLTVNGQHFNNAMPRFPLTDQDIACALTFVYNTFGNSGKEVTPEEVSTVRSEKEEPVSAPLSAKVPEPKSPYE